MEADLHSELPAWFVEIDEAAGRALCIQAERHRHLDDDCRDLLLALIEEPTLGLAASGSYRRAVVGSSIVLKVPNPLLGQCGSPCTVDGVWSNIYEAGPAQIDYTGPVAPCRIAWHESGVPVLVMERVQMWDEVHPTLLRAHRLPAWKGETDKEQIGWSESVGGWAIYDAGCPPRMAHVPEPAWWFSRLAA